MGEEASLIVPGSLEDLRVRGGLDMSGKARTFRTCLNVMHYACKDFVEDPRAAPGSWGVFERAGIRTRASYARHGTCGETLSDGYISAM